MKQVVQDAESGVLRVVEVPAPLCRPGGLLVRTEASVISVGTEKMKLDFARKSIVGKALERPDQVRRVLETVSREGLASTYRKVRSRLAQLSPMGYSLAGVVEAVGDGVVGLEVGQRVACAGAGYANHAERVWVPRNLVVPVPDGVPAGAAAFTTVGAIALQGVRQADVRLGETVAVIGLGLLGQLTLRILRAAGARAVGIDTNAARVALAERAGAHAIARGDDVAGRVEALTGGFGADAVIITAATSSPDPIRLAGRLARDRARVVVVGAVPVDVPRNEYFAKELEVRLSRSYGPGRYDPSYEEKGIDYPIGYVRWTEGRNMAEFVRLLETGGVQIDDLVTHRFPFAEAAAAYEALTVRGGGALGVVLEYPGEPVSEPRRIALPAGAARPKRAAGQVRIGLVGAGGFATATLLPHLRGLGVDLVGVATASGITARNAAEQHGFRYVAASADELFGDPDIDAIVIATRHDEHARLAAAALRAGKAVFVEKPLALDEASLDEVLAAAAAGPQLLVGFNRRFAPAVDFVRERLRRTAGARVVNIRVNAGAVPPASWVHDPAIGGGRLVGEGCHFVDLALYLAGSTPVDVRAAALGGADPAAAFRDNVHVTLRCADGSLASILYTAKGNPRSGKEWIEVFAGGATAVIDDFRRAEFWGERKERWKGSQDKGHAAELRAFVDAVRGGGPSPIALEEVEASSRATLQAAAALGRLAPEPL